MRATRDKAKCGEVIGVVRMHAFEGMRETPAVVVWLDDERIGARLAAGPDEGCLIMLERAAYRRTWQ
ncbi:hypothetical protein [Paraburkholderia adhaesiva]|uniref:hypothetical protein n=1 Tax=Paraburkholderia adhaesiva TaxID=2883244 RepID=UPI001F41517B|nr:hypothetical protein [Paraburkholderia adhaesiva]